MKRFAVWIAIVAVLLMAQGCAQKNSRGSVDDDERAAEIYSNLGLGYLRQGRYELALEKLKLALGHERNNKAANLYIAEVYKQLGEVEMADEHYAKSVKLDPENPMVLNNYGAFLCDQSRLEDAEVYLVRAANMPRYSSPELAFENLALCALRSDDRLKAEKYFRKALEIRPTLPKALFRMAQLSHDKKDFLRARAFIERYHGVVSKSANSLMLAIEIEQAMGNETAVKEYKNELRENFPQSDDRS